MNEEEAQRIAEKRALEDAEKALGTDLNWNAYWRSYWYNYWRYYMEALAS